MKRSEFKDFEALLLATAEYYRQSVSAASEGIWWRALERLDFAVVKGAFEAHIAVSKFMPTVAEVLDAVRTADGRPAPEEAWASVARLLNDERSSVVWTEEMAVAFGVALGLSHDRIAARMAFKESYEHAVADARRKGVAVKWVPCLGQDPSGREGVLAEAVKAKRLTAEHIAGLLPYREAPSAQTIALLAPAAKALPVAGGKPEATATALKSLRDIVGLNREAA